jgi:hypothetical protein
MSQAAQSVGHEFAVEKGAHMGLQLPKWLLQFSGKLYVHNFLFFALYDPGHHKVTGPEVRLIMEKAQPGDILLRRYDGYLNTIFTPGFWGHAALYAGENRVIHAIGEGVVSEDIITFCRTDSICLLRPKNATPADMARAIECAKKHQKHRTKYDYRFNDRNGTVYCTELVNICFQGTFDDDFENIAGNCILAPDGVRRSNNVDTILEFQHQAEKIWLARLINLFRRKRAVTPCTPDKETCERVLEARRPRQPNTHRAATPSCGS